MKRLTLFLTCAMTLGSAALFAQKNEETNLPKGELYNVPVRDVAQEYKTLGVVEDIFSKKWKTVNNKILETGAYVANSTYRNESLAIKLPKVNSIDERINLHVAERFELESYQDEGKIMVSTDNGKNWEVVSVRSGKSDDRISVINLTKYAGQKIKLAFELKTDESNNYGGWTVESAEVKHELNKYSMEAYVGSMNGPTLKSASMKRQMKAASASSLSGSFSSVDASGFNESVTLHCEVSDQGNPLLSLTEDNFTVWEEVDSIWTFDSEWPEGKLLRDYRNKKNAPKFFVVETPNSTTNQKIADIVFLIDNSGSMGNDQAAVNNNVKAFLQALTDKGISANLGFVRFGQTGDYMPIVEKNALGTSWWSNYQGDTTVTGLAAFQKAWVDRNITSGGTEPAYDALLAAASPAYTPNANAQRIAILMTDESITGNNSGRGLCENQAMVIQTMKDANFVVHSISEENDTHCVSDFKTISDATNGNFYDLDDDFSDILDAISTSIANKYEITYSPVRGEFDGLKRDVEIVVDYNSQKLVLKGKSYVPGSAPKVELTQHTQDTLFHSHPWLEKQSPIIEAYIYDFVTPRPQDGLANSYVTLVYKHVDSKVWSETPMTLTETIGQGDTTKWSGSIPANVIVKHGMEFYIKVSDGETSGMTPLNPLVSPWSFAVWPNHAPSMADSTLYINSQERNEAILNKSGYTVGDNVCFRLWAKDDTEKLTSVKIFIKTFGDGFDEHEMISQPNDIWSFNANLAKGSNKYYFQATDDYKVSNWIGSQTKPYVIDGAYLDCDAKHTIVVEDRRSRKKIYTDFCGEPFDADDCVVFLYKDDQGRAREYDRKTIDQLRGPKGITLFCEDMNSAGRDGYILGEEIIVKVWRDKLQRLVPAYVSYYNAPNFSDLTFGDQKKTLIDSIIVRGQKAPITRGAVSPEMLWSSYVDFEDYAMDSVFHAYHSDIVWVENGYKERWAPKASNNTLTTYEPGMGYNVRLKSGIDTINFEAFGEQRDYTTEAVKIHTYDDGGSLLGCPYKQAEGLTNIIGNNDIDAVYRQVDNEMQCYIPSDMSWSNWTSDLNIYPGKAYVFESASSTYDFTFPAPKGPLMSATLKGRTIAPKTMAQKVRDVNEFMSLLLPDRAWSTLPTDGDRVKVVSSTGELLGENFVYNHGSLIILDGLDLKEGDLFEVYYCKQDSKEEIRLEINEWEKGDDTYRPMKMAIAACVNNSLEQANESIISNLKVFPNPTQEGVQCELSMAEAGAGEVTLTDNKGAVVYRQSGMKWLTGQQTLRLPVELVNGIYTLTIKGSEGLTLTEKVIVK